MFYKLNDLVLSLAVGLLYAQDESPGELEEVVVTAQFRDTPLMQTAGSISVLDQTRLFDRGALHLQDALNVLPNVSFSSGGSRARFVQIRGIGDLEQFVDPKYFPSVGISMDDFAQSWHVIAGLRFETFEDDYSDTNGLNSKTDDQYLTGELTLQYHLDDGSMLYGTVSCRVA